VKECTLVNLHYNYVTQLLNNAEDEIKNSRHKDALTHIRKAFIHLDVLAESKKIRGDLPMESVDQKRMDLIDLLHQLPPNSHYSDKNTVN
jgi:hypothetical protein